MWTSGNSGMGRSGSRGSGGRQEGLGLPDSMRSGLGKRGLLFWLPTKPTNDWCVKSHNCSIILFIWRVWLLVKYYYEPLTFWGEWFLNLWLEWWNGVLSPLKCQSVLFPCWYILLPLTLLILGQQSSATIVSEEMCQVKAEQSEVSSGSGQD